MAEDQTERPIVKLDGTEISEGLYEDLSSALVEQSIHVPDMCTLRFFDPDFETFDAGTFQIGKELEISFSDGDDVTVVTTAEITSISVEPEPTGRHEIVVLGLGKGHRLARSTKIRTFEQKTDGDIASEIAGDYGLTVDSDSTTTTYPWLVQTTNDYAFLTQRAEMIGFTWWVTGSKLYFKKSSSDGAGPTLKWPDDLFSFKVRFSAAENVQGAKVRGWDSATQQSFEGASTVAAGSDVLGSGATAATDANTAMDGFTSARLTGLAPVADQGEAQALANSAVTRGYANEVVARGIASGVPSMKPGTEITLDGAGEKLSGTYLLTSVDHVYRAGERYVTRFRSGGRGGATLVDMLGRRSQAPDLGTRLLAGVVTSTDDPDNSGRVKVKFPTLSDENESAWARIAAPGAGDTRGMLNYPEVNDEVLVGFEAGDPRRPLILGGIWSAKYQPPAAAADAIKDNAVVTRGWYSRLGHKIEMSDGTSDDAKSVAIDLADGQTKLYLGQDQVTLDAPTKITVTGQDDIEITTSSKGVTITAASITLKATQDLSLEGANVTIKGSAGVTIDGGKTDVKASGMLNVQAGGIAAVKGSMVKLN